MLPIFLRGARTHNLAGIDLELAPGELVALTGPSGSGKSSLAIDTLYAEGQRRFVESFSPYARQFLERIERPPIDSLDPVAAGIAIDRRAPAKSSRSTLATMTDLEPYLAALFAKEAIPRCPDCGTDAVPTAAADAAARVVRERGGARALVSYGARVDGPEAFLEFREQLVRDGWRRVLVGGVVRDLDLLRPSDALAQGPHLGVIVDRVAVASKGARRLQQAIEVAWERGHGRADLLFDTGATPGPHAIVRGLSCPSCGRVFDPPRPGLFSYNSPLGACAACKGFGRIVSVDWDKVVPDPDKTIAGGAIRAWTGKSATWERRSLTKFCARTGIPGDVPWGRLSPEQRSAVIDGEGSFSRGKFPGVRAWFKWLESRIYKLHVRVFLARYREYRTCETCGGGRLNKASLAYRVGGRDLSEWHALTVSQALEATRAVVPHDPQGRLVRGELESRLGTLDAVGLGYLGLDRAARTLSGGEAQRASLTTALGSSLTGALFVLDEPTVGLHALDVPRVAVAVRNLARAGNTVVVVEHDETIIRSCARVIELGPGAGPAGGRIVFDGSPDALAVRADLPTGAAWRAHRTHATRTARRPTGHMSIRGARAHNLRNVDVDIPLGVVCAITGPSGSGKSTLVRNILYRAVARALGDLSIDRAGPHDAVDGIDAIGDVTLVDQSPLGRTARGNAATYTKAWDRIRARFAAEPSASRAGFGPSHFSFNVAGAGRCEACAGEGFETVEMQFLADVSLVCPLCHGARFKPEVLAIHHRKRTIADVLAMSVDDTLAEFGEDDPVLVRALEPLVRVGLGYIPLGQPLSMLSGGEAQRVKLARALARLPHGSARSRSLLVLDEPSTSLHAQDMKPVLLAIHALVDKGASVVVVEHDLDVIRSCDWVIDLGPGAGPDGGRVVAKGTPQQIARTDTRTGLALRLGVGASASAGTSAGVGVNPGVPAIKVEHAREHNLQNVSVAVPHGTLCVMTGPSGSGKSSLAFDVIFAEGQRRFMDTLTPYARQFLPTLPRPDVDRVTGVPPAIALEQRTARGGGSSTVATVTEVAHYLRLLYAKVGELHCPKCDAAVAPSSPDALFERLVRTRDGSRKTVYAPAVRARKGTYLDLFTQAARAGVKTARIDGAIVAIDPPPKLAKTREHTIDLIMHFGPLSMLDRATLDRALEWGAGSVRVSDGPPTPKEWRESIHSIARTCSRCGEGVPELDPRWFSFNTKQGQCAACEGVGRNDAGKICTTCGGSRLAAVPRGVRICGERYHELCARDIRGAIDRVRTWRFENDAATIARAPLAELLRRLEFAQRVGLGYLALDRGATTLSGGELQRLRLSAQLGAGLTGALYVLDEPTIGLHPRDTKRLILNLRALVATGSTVLVVEHDEETIRAADHVIDLGPGGGRLGGRIVAEGSAAEVLANPRSPTAVALAAGPFAERKRLGPTSKQIVLRGAREHNLKNVDFRVPVGRMTVVCGVSGSGKSTLVRQVFERALRRALGLVTQEPGAHDSITGHAHVARALAVDQAPIGRTPCSVPATFLGVWDPIRRLFAAMPAAKTMGFGPARFSFNAPRGGGRCPTCNGQGVIVSEMSFLPDVVSPCETCNGARFEPATLDVTYNNLSVAEVLHLSAEDAARTFAAHPKIARPLGTLADLGVGYVQLGQGSHTLSGGEAQRLKLATELALFVPGSPTVYVLDEPTTGLHLSDVRRLVRVLDRLIVRGDTLVIVEHHPDVIASADWVVELGPDGGDAGGRVVFEGTPDDLRKAKTATGTVLRGRRA